MLTRLVTNEQTQERRGNSQLDK